MMDQGDLGEPLREKEFAKAIEDEKYGDMKIKVKGGTFLHCRESMLCYHSEFIRKLFEVDMIEKKTRTWDLSEFEKETVVLFLSIFNSFGSAKVFDGCSPIEMKDLFQIAHRFRFTGLLQTIGIAALHIMTEPKLSEEVFSGLDIFKGLLSFVICHVDVSAKSHRVVVKKFKKILYSSIATKENEKLCELIASLLSGDENGLDYSFDSVRRTVLLGNISREILSNPSIVAYVGGVYSFRVLDLVTAEGAKYALKKIVRRGKSYTCRIPCSIHENSFLFLKIDLYDNYYVSGHSHFQNRVCAYASKIRNGQLYIDKKYRLYIKNFMIEPMNDDCEVTMSVKVDHHGLDYGYCASKKGSVSPEKVHAVEKKLRNGQHLDFTLNHFVPLTEITIAVRVLKK